MQVDPVGDSGEGFFATREELVTGTQLYLKANQ